MKDLIGFIYNDLEVISYSHKDTKRRLHCWNSKCKCGKVVTHDSNVITKKRRKNCGCKRPGAEGNKNAFKHGFTKHGGAHHPLYRTRNGMMTRCYNAKRSEYPYYQGKGIEVCEEWKNSPQKFYEWALQNGWAQGLTLDRKNSDKNYEPSNCHFISLEENLKRMHASKKISRDLGL